MEKTRAACEGPKTINLPESSIAGDESMGCA